jgi:hypothetical protein
MNKTYKINTVKFLFDLLIGLLGVAALIYVLIHFQWGFSLRQSIYWAVGTITCAFMIVRTAFMTVSKIIFEGNLLKISYILFRKREIYFSKVKDFSVHKKFRNIQIYFIDNRKPLKFRLINFNLPDREAICDNIAEIMKGLFENYTEEQLDSFYEDKNQYNFSVTERHFALWILGVAFGGLQTFIVAVCVILLLIFPPPAGMFSVIEAWYLWFLLFWWITVILLDALIPKRTLNSKNGIITFLRNEKVIFSFKAQDVIKYWLTYKKFTYVLLQTPKKEKTISLMGFSRKDNKKIRNNLELLFDFS